MKKILTLAGAFIICAGVYAQDDAQKAAADAAAALVGAPKEELVPEKPKYWDWSSKFDVGINQTSLRSWAAGGFDNITLSTGVDAKANFAKGRTTWNNRLQLQYGFIWSQDKSYILQKSNDRIYFESKFSHKTAKETWNWTASYDFRSQFTDSYSNYDYPFAGEQGEMDQHMREEMKHAWDSWRETSLKSTFLSPAYNNLALGIEWKPAPWFDVNISPLTGSVTIVTEPLLRQKYGMHEKEGSMEVYPYYSALFQLGASVKANAKFSINDKFNYETQLVLFTDYLNNPFTEVRVNWDNAIAWQIAKFFKIGFSTWLIYDPIVEIDGVKSKLQFKEFLSFNFTYTLGGKK